MKRGRPDPPVDPQRCAPLVDRVCDAFWSGGISNPLEVIEEITYLLFIRRLDDLETLEERKARLGAAGELRFGSDQQELRWARFKNQEPAVMFATVGERVFPFLRTLGGDGSTYGEHMKDARFTIPAPQLLSRVVDLLDEIPMNDWDTNGYLYEYLLSKIASRWHRAGHIELAEHGPISSARRSCRATRAAHRQPRHPCRPSLSPEGSVRRC
ncbi:type I restriction-modification system subunit M N-terminal domain-containing protein [Mycobacterium neumannii]|uniref:type I restriction-modification system subunit M N-terminal domain-containing protein n=1 Tax=Mycobacterium neumannii TaxID=2048551 RepID=UPI003AB36090